MRLKTSIILLIFLFVGLMVNAQFALVKDTSFARYLCKNKASIMSTDCKSLDTVAAGNLLGNFSLANGKLKDVSELAYFKKLVSLNLINNQIEDLPDVSKIPRLKIIDIRNGIWTKTEQLLPLKNTLEVLFIGLKNGKKIPDLSFLELYPKLLRFQCLDCQAEILPDFSKLPLISKVIIPDNKLSFTDLLPLTKIANYDTIFISLFPQRNLTNDTIIKTSSNTQFRLTTSIDKGLTGITYDWYKNGQLVQSSSSPDLTFSKVQVSDTGVYFQQIRSDHPFFAGKSVRTGNFSVQVCEAVSSVELKDLKGCSDIPLQIESINKNPKFKTESIKLTQGVDTQRVEIGKEYILPTGTYGIVIKDTLGCVFAINPLVTLTKSNCQDLFSPNNDGLADDIFIEGTGKALIRNKQGIVVKELDLPATWNGTDSRGNPLTIGLYVVELPDGNTKKVTLVR